MIISLTRGTALRQHSFNASFRPSHHYPTVSPAVPSANLENSLFPASRSATSSKGREKHFYRQRYQDQHILGRASSRDGYAIIVEGYADKVAVQKAVPYAVFVLGSSTWVEGKNSAAVLAKLRQGLPTFQKTYVLMDPDFAGRKGRYILETTFPGHLWHAFIPAGLATSLQKTRWHEAGNIGVEHASPTSIRDALASSRLASLGRTHFTRDRLMSLGLTASFDDPLATRMRERRDMVCSYLGIGSCDGKQLLRQLNVYNFTDEDLARAIQCKAAKNI